MGLFDGKVAIVTGAGRGIGREEALLLAREGAAVVVNDLGGEATGEGADSRPAQQVVDEIVAAGGTAAANYDDCSSWAGAEAMVNQAVETFGGLDVLVNNAGILRDKMSFNMTEEEWDAVIKVHLKGHFAPSKFAASYWRAKSKETGEPVNAKIVNTSSESGLYGNAGQANYAAAKAGIASMTIVLARELSRFGVRVNAIAPVGAHPPHRGARGRHARRRPTASSTRCTRRTRPPVSASWPPTCPTASRARCSRCRAGTRRSCRVGARSARSTATRPGRSSRSPRSATRCSRRPTPASRPSTWESSDPPMQLSFGPETEAFRDELIAFLDEHAPTEARHGFDYADANEDPDGDIVPEWSRRWQATLFDHGWMIPGYPPELGGRNATPLQTLVYLEEMARRRIPRSMHFPGTRSSRPACSSSATRSRSSWCPRRSAATPSGASG